MAPDSPPKNMPKLRHIFRLTKNAHRQDAYLVRVSRKGQRMYRFFPLSKYESEDAALNAALEYRESAYKLLGINTTNSQAEEIIRAAATLTPAARASVACALIHTLTPHATAHA